MDLSVERDSSSLGSLFQQIINDMKNSSPLWEDFVAKASKLHACLRAAIQAIAAYLDAFQKIADAATNSRGASKEIGTALTRVCLRHKAVETRLKTFTTSIMDCLVQPLQEKLEDWKRSVATIDKEHTKEYKRCRTELKKRSSDTLRLQKKARKGQSDSIQSLMDSHMQDVNLRRAELEEVEKKSLRSAMVEERMRYCTFVHMLQPVVREECEVMFELGHLQEAMQSIANVTKDPTLLPQSSEELIHDAKATMSLYPESPGGSGSHGCSNSLGSRKSSVCSISSMNSSGSSNSPSHHHYPRSLSQLIPPTAIRLKPGESSDSGFCSSSPALTAQASTATSQSHAGSTWPPHSQENVAPLPTDDRPHTISTTYEKSHQRPPLTVYTFQNPETIMEGGGGGNAPPNGVMAAPNDGHNANNAAQAGQTTPNTVGQKSPAAGLSRPPLPVRCSSLERPLPANARSGSGNLMPRQCPSPIPAHITKELPQHSQQPPQQQPLSPSQQPPPQPPSQAPTYANMYELASMTPAPKKPSTNNTLQQQNSTESTASQFSNDFVVYTPPPQQPQQGPLQQPHQQLARGHSSTSSTTSSLHSHPSIESTVATSAMGHTPPTSSGSSTPQNHYSPLLTNSPTSTGGAGTPSGASITSGGLNSGGFNYNVSSPTPPHSGNLSSASDVLKITEQEAINHQHQQAAVVNGGGGGGGGNDAAAPDNSQIVENDERSRASVLQKASMFEKQAAAAASSASPQASAREAIYGTRRSEEFRERDRSLPTHLPQQQAEPSSDQQDVDKSFEDSIQELNNLIGELDSFQREIDTGKAQQQQQHTSMPQPFAVMHDPFAPLPASTSQAVGGSDQVDSASPLAGMMAPGGGVSISAATASLLRQQEQQQQQKEAASIQTNSSGCGTDISDTTSDEHNTSAGHHHLYAEAGKRSLGHHYNSDSEMSRCYVSETSSLSGYENPTFAHLACSASTTALNAVAAGVAAGVAGLSAMDSASIGGSCSLLPQGSETDSMSLGGGGGCGSGHRLAYVDSGSDCGSAVVVIYDHQIPITPDIDYVKQNSEIVLLRTKDPQQQHQPGQEVRELQQLPVNLGVALDSPTSSFATATVAPAKQRLSSFRASSEQQLQLLGLGGSNSRAQSPHHLQQQHHHLQQQQHHHYYEKGMLDVRRRDLKEPPGDPSGVPRRGPGADTIPSCKSPQPKPILSATSALTTPLAELNNNSKPPVVGAPAVRPPIPAKTDFKADLDAKIRKQRLRLQLHKQPSDPLKPPQPQQQQPQAPPPPTPPKQQQSSRSIIPTATTTQPRTTTTATTTNHNCNTDSSNATTKASSSSSSPHAKHHLHHPHYEPNGSPTPTPNIDHPPPPPPPSTTSYSPIQYQSSPTSPITPQQAYPRPPPSALEASTPPPPSSSHSYTHPSVACELLPAATDHYKFAANAVCSPCSPPTPPPPATYTNCSSAVGGVARSASSVTATTTINHHTSASVHVNKPNITPRPASLAGGGTRIARRQSVNTAKPPPPVRRSSSVTPCHNQSSATTPSQKSSQHSSASSLNYQAQTPHHQQPPQQQQDSLCGSTENLPPPPAYLLEQRQSYANSSTPTSPQPIYHHHEQQQTHPQQHDNELASSAAAAANTHSYMPNSAMKVAETVKALSALRSNPTSPQNSAHYQQQMTSQSSAGIYAQPKIMSNMSSFQSAGPPPQQIYQPAGQPVQPKTNPNLIAQLNARLNTKQQQQHPQNPEPIYQQHDPIYMRNYGQQQQHQQQQQQQYGKSLPQSQQQHQQQQQQQQQQYHDDYATSTQQQQQIDKAGSIRSKTKAEFLENLNAKLAKQGMSGRAFAVRNLINSKAMMYQHATKLPRPSVAPTPTTNSLTDEPDPRMCHGSLMDQIKRGATLKRNQKINDRSAPKIH